MYKPRLTLLQQGILRYLFIKAGTALTAHAIAVALNVSQPAVSKALPGLEKNNLIVVTKDRETKRLAISINRDDPQVTGLKRVDNLKQVYESGLTRLLYDNLKGATVILFGSYAHGEDTITSDVDIAVVGMHGAKELELAKLEKELGRKIVLNFYESFKKINGPLLNNILNGIVLKGAVEL